MWASVVAAHGLSNCGSWALERTGLVVPLHMRSSQTRDQTDALCIVKVLVAQSCLTLCDPVDCSPPGSSVHGIFQASILEWIASSPSPPGISSRGSSLPRDQTHVSFVSCKDFAGGFFTSAQSGKPVDYLVYF